MLDLMARQIPCGIIGLCVYGCVCMATCIGALTATSMTEASPMLQLT